MGPVLMMITDRRPTADSLPERVAAAARAGVHLIQIRAPDLEARACAELAAACVRAVGGTRTRVIVNDRMDVAIAAGASGIHLRADSVPPERARALLPRPAIVGRSIHGAGELETLSPGGALDYVVFGTVFTTGSKPGRTPAGLRALSRAAACTPIPVLAVGGVTLERVAALASSGAAGFAAISLFREPPPAQLAEVVARVQEAWVRRS